MFWRKGTLSWDTGQKVEHGALDGGGVFVEAGKWTPIAMKSQQSVDDLQAELEILYKRIRDEFAPPAFLYDLRIHGGLAHQANMREAAKAAIALGFPKSGWHRTHYLNLLNRLTSSISQTSEHLRSGAS